MKKKTSFVVVDLVEDKIKTRGLFVVVSLLFYVYMTWMFFIGNEKRDTSPHSMEISLEFPHIITIGDNFTQYMAPQVKVMNSRGERLKDVKVNISVLKVTTDTSKTS